jgi:hypothetical protein
MAVSMPANPRLNDRVAVFGQTGTGKSILAHHLFKTVPTQLPNDKGEGGFWKIAIDITDSIYDLESVGFADPTAIPWDVASSLRFVPQVETMEEDINILYLAIMAHGFCWVWCDEVNEISTAHKTIIGMRKILLQGRKFQIGHAGVTPRPVDVNKSIITQSEHLFIFPLINPDDRNILARTAGIPLDEFEEAMANLEDFGYLWFNVRDRVLYSMPALPLEYVETLEG